MISKQRIYTRQCNDEAIALVLRQGYTCVQAGRQLVVPRKACQANGTMSDGQSLADVMARTTAAR